MELLKRPTILYDIHHRKFEELVADVLRDYFLVEVSIVGKTDDGGVDLLYRLIWESCGQNGLKVWHSVLKHREDRTMQDRELYRQLLGLKEPWKVIDLKVDFEALRVDVYIEWPPEDKAPCPECGKFCAIYDHREERKWRHLDTMQFETILHCRPPRVQCMEHKVKSVAIPWAEKNSRFTALFERMAIDVLLGCQNQTRAKELLRLSWDEVHRIQAQAVERGMQRRQGESLRHVGVDEKSFLKGHQYATVLNNIEKARVIDVARDRTEEALSGMLLALPESQRKGIEAVGIDMWAPFMKAIGEHLPEAEIVHDRFHIMKHVCEAVDKVRRAEHKTLTKNGVDILKGMKYLFLTNPEKWSKEQKTVFREAVALKLRSAKACTMKDMIRSLWDYRYEGAARNFFGKWYWWATHSRMKPMSEAAKMMKRHLEGILTYIRHGITNAVAEALNGRIQQIKAAARGFRNFDNFRAAILFHLGGLNLYPQKTQ